jgi:Sec-independent protein translocase protein TatA
MALFDSGIPEIVILLAIAALIFGTTRLRSPMDSSWSDLQKELQAHMPVYSAETTSGKEAEFIRDRLPTRAPKLTALLVLVVVFGVIAWWLTGYSRG